MEPAFRRAPSVPFAFAHVIGYTGLAGEEDLKDHSGLVPEDQIGRAGLEAYYDDVLRGTDGKEIAFRDASGNVEEGQKIAPSRPGDDSSKTFIDGDLQEFLHQRLATALHDLNRTVGVAIAMDPRNGEVLALVDIPSFDPNHIPEALAAPGNRFLTARFPGSITPVLP